MKSCAIFTAAAIVLAAPSAAAQFTTAIPPRPTPAESPAAVARADSLARDTTTSSRLTDMKAWVDSAAVAIDAGAPAPAMAADTLRTDTTVVVPAPAPTDAVERRGATRDAVLRDGAPAPDTASPLPLLALLGAGALAAGAWLRRR
ncbi:MAG: hypothetical protein M3373_13245 [Gemmatimonadota bacterium]|nr:hypothetical protein [Gemmatimonadota bacterium]